MLEASSSGPGQPKSRSINAEANLLGEWLQARSRLQEQSARYAAALTLLVLLFVGTLPLLVGLARSASDRAEIAHATQSAAELRVTNLEREKESVRPRVDENAMRELVERQSRSFLGQALLLMNASVPGLSIESISGEVIGGEMTLRCRADAENSGVAQEFIKSAGAGPGVNSTLLSKMERNGRLGKDGVGFEYVKRVEVAP